MTLRWETQASGLGWNYHIAGDYLVEPEDLDIGHWSVWFRQEGKSSENIGHGTWRQCRKLAEQHHAGVAQ